MKRRNSKTVVGIVATTKLWIQDMDLNHTYQLYHLTHCRYPSMCFFNQFDLIHHWWQMMASGSNRNEKQQNSDEHCSNCQTVNPGHGLWSLHTSYAIWHAAGTRPCASSISLTWVITSDKWCWPLGQIGTQNSKTVVGIAAATKLLPPPCQCLRPLQFFKVKTLTHTWKPDAQPYLT
jgi:hypothetical protein